MYFSNATKVRSYLIARFYTEEFKPPLHSLGHFIKKFKENGKVTYNTPSDTITVYRLAYMSMAEVLNLPFS